MPLVMVVLSVVVDMSPDVGLLMLLEGGAVDGDEVCRRRRRRRGGHRVGGVHPSADSQTDLEGVQLCHNAEFEVLLLLLLALLLARSSPEIAPPRSESEERGNMPAAAALTPLARSFLPRVLSLLLCVSLPRTHSH